MKITLLLLIVCCLASAVPAQRWEPTGGPGRGRTSSATIGYNGDLYVLGKNIFRSTDDGASWKNISPRLQLDVETSNELVVARNGTLLLCTPSELLRSTNGGTSWEHALKLNGKPDIAIAKTGTILVTNVSYILYSTDNGLSWASTKPSTSYNGGSIFPLTDGSIFASDSTSLLRSADDGRTWEKVQRPSAYQARDIISLSDGSILLATGGSLSISFDTARTWKRLEIGSIIDLDRMHDSIYALNVYGELYLSIDHGNTWKHAAAQLVEAEQMLSHTNTVYLRARFGMFSRTTPLTDPWRELLIPNAEVLQMEVAPDRQIVAMTGMFRANFSQWSLDSTFAWKPDFTSDDFSSETTSLHDFVIDGDGRTLAIVFGTFARNSVTAQGWDYGEKFPGKNFQIALSPSSVFVTTDQGIFASTNSGGTWQLVTEPHNFFGITILPNIIYAVGSQVFTRSLDHGKTWEEPPFPFISGSGLSRTMVAQGDIVVVGVDRTGVYFSSDRGSIWENHSTGLALDTIFQLLMTPDSSLFAASTSGVYQYNPSSRSWLNVSDVLPAGAITSIVLGADNKIYVGTDGKGVYRSTRTYRDWKLNVHTRETSEITLFPNPASDVVTLRGIPSLPSVKFVVCDLLGTSVEVSRIGETLDVSTLRNGRYFLRIISQDGIRTFPLSILR